jgi:esterase/lipase
MGNEKMYISKYDHKIRFLSYDGIELTGTFAKSKRQTKAAVLMLHGIPSWQHEWGFYSKMAECFCDNGIASLRFNYRFWYDGLNKYGNLNKLTLSQLINDSESAYWKLRGLITGRVPIYVVARSFAGGVSIKWINAFNRSINKIYLMAPCFDYEYELFGNYKNYTSAYNQLLNEEQINLLTKNGYINQELNYGREMCNEAHVFNIYNELKIINSKIIIFHGTGDTIVPIDITEKILMDYPEIELIKIKDAKHSFGGLKRSDGTSDSSTKNKNIQFIINRVVKDILCEL